MTGDAVKIHVLTTGGTIDKEYTLEGNLEIGSPMASVVLAEARTGLDISFESVCAKDSLDLDDTDRIEIRKRVEGSETNHILITHGTDTMIDTAAVLLGMPGKVIVLTGSMQPARMRDSDAPFNLGLAIGALQCLPAGVYIAMSGRVFAAGKAVKNRERGLFVDNLGIGDDA